MSGQVSLDWVISVDDHVIEPPDLWQKRVPAKYRDAAPHVVQEDEGDAWIYEGRRKPISGMSVAADKRGDEVSVNQVRFSDMRPGCYDPRERTRDMDLDGVLASLCFPSFPRFCGQEFYEANDRELALLCVRAYNDWMIEEWCGSVPGRLIPLIILPLWDPAEAAHEIDRCAERGARAITFPENAAPLGLPSIHDRNQYWDPVFSAACANQMPICTHIGSSSKLPQTAPDAPFIIPAALSTMNAITTLTDWIFSGQFLRFPELKLCLSEGGIGWIPHVLERCNYTLERQAGWIKRGELPVHLGFSDENYHTEGMYEIRPSDVFREHIYGCFIDDQHGVDSLDAIGVDNVMIESDYPHTDTSFPHTLTTAKKRLASRSDEDIYKIFQGNARRVFRFEPAEPPTKQDVEAASRHAGEK